MSPRTLALHLAMTPGIGGRTVARVVARNAVLSRSPEEFLRLASEAWREEYRISKRSAALLASGGPDAIRATADLEARLESLGVVLFTAADVHYPAVVEDFDPDPPGVLFAYGNLGLLARPSFTVLASRGSLPRHLDHIERLAEEGVLAGEVLVAGHDRPEYQRAAVVPLRWGSPRILCLDQGLFRVLGEDLRNEAFRAARLWRYEFDPRTDLCVSPFRPEAGFVGVNNKIRDRLVAAFARRHDFVTLAAGGNMERLARMALAAGRPVRVTSEAAGYVALIAAGATELAA